ncbi:MAG: Glucosemethanolcholine oxidoreductaseNAD binding site [Tardiphaga sp.]|nr:Glucosemethanolcholine oxidoreductaseNAD binding site [Tardiphaga sp.]
MPLNRLGDTGQPIAPPDVQRTTMSLDVMGRFICNTWDEAIHNGGAPFDCIVIGGGMFGGYCATRISRAGGNPSLRVLVLEAGPFLVPTHVQNLPRTGLDVPSPMLPSQDNGVGRNLVWGMPWRSNVAFVGQAYCVGGKSLYWGGWCPRLQDDDLASWPPSVAQYLQQHYPTMERQLGVADTTDFIQGPLYDLLHTRITDLAQSAVQGLTGVESPPLAVQGQSPASGLFAFDKYSSVTVLIDAVREAAGQSDASRPLFVVPNAHVTRLESHNGVVTGLHASVGGTARYVAIAPECAVILAAGMIESTRLALLSFPTSANGQPEMIGRHLISHVRSNMFFRVRRSALDQQGVLPALLQTGALLVRGRGPQGKFQIQLTASADMSGNSDALLYTMIPDIDQLDALLSMQQAGWISFALRGASEMPGDTATVPNASGSWINLSPFESDEFGMPRAYVSMTTTAGDEALAATMEQCMIALAKGLANNNDADLEMDNPFRDALGSTYHESGTLWMGTDPAASVTDPNGRFHHVANAYCADQSLFVTVGSVNPTLTGLTLARKVSDAVIAKSRGQPAPA